MQITETKFSKIYNRDMSLFGAFPRSDLLRFAVLVPRVFGATEVAMLLHSDALDFPKDMEKSTPLLWEGLQGDCDVYTCSLSLAEIAEGERERRLFYYCYRITGAEGTEYYGGEEPTVLMPTHEQGDRQLLLFDDDYTTCEPMGQGIIYHIFVDRFCKSGKCQPREGTVLNEDWEDGIPQYGAYPGAKVSNNVFFGGDLYGVAEKLDYIAQLGTKTLYLSPVFEAASNHKYDTADYLTVDSAFGGEEALRNLIERAKERGIRVILDGVFNHTGSDSVYFNREGHYGKGGAYRDKQSPYYPWYTFKEYPDDYACWWGVDILPRVNSADPTYLHFIFEKVIPKWMHMGIGGWRLDVADELEDVFLKGLRKTVKSIDPHAPVIGEVWEDATHKIAYGNRRAYLQGQELDSVMNYPLREAIIDFIRNGNAETLRRVTGGQYRRYPKQVSDCLMNFLGTHDTQRILTVLGGREQGDLSNAELSVLRMTSLERKSAVVLLKLAYALLVAMPGVPCVFYGDEVGMEGYRDPFCRLPFPWHKTDKDLLAYYRKLGKIRAEEPLLREGAFENLIATAELYVFRRTPWAGEKDCLTVAVNRSERAIPLAFSCEARDLLTGERGKEITLAPMTAVYLKMPFERTE